MMKKIALLQRNYYLIMGGMVLFILNTNHLMAQNLVLNPSFENTKAKFRPCSFMEQDYVFTEYVNHWSTTLGLTPDLLRTPSSEDDDTCEFKAARTGRNAAGIIVYHPAMDSGYDYDFHEYIQGKLKQPLVQGEQYVVRFWVQQSKALILRHLRAKYAAKTNILPLGCNNIGVHFSTVAFGQNEYMHTTIREFGIRPHVETTEVITTQPDEWIQLQFVFEAKSAWQYFTIGNFKADIWTTTDLDTEVNDKINAENEAIGKLRGINRRVAYYLIDDVEILPYDEADFLTNSLTNSANYTFKNLLFDSGKSILKPGSFEELNILVDWLESQPTKTIIIGGHTDDIGDNNANQKLSMNRAKAVYNYLIEKGIDAQQITYKGYGESQPKVENTSDKNRAINRRVEVVVE